MPSTPQYGYIKAAGDPDYNFGYNDFTVEFFAELGNTTGIQTLFEITNNESPASTLYEKTRFLTVVENGNIDSFAVQTYPIILTGGANVFTNPLGSNSNIKMFYNGNLLLSNQYSIVSGNVVLSNLTTISGNILAEVGNILFEVPGNSFTANTMHFVSAERSQGEFYLFLDGLLQVVPVSANVTIPLQTLPLVNNPLITLNRIDGPSLLTIGANRDGLDPFFGNFGDFKIINGNAEHVNTAEIRNIITSNFTDSNLGLQSANIIIDGGSFISSITNHTPEELVDSQIFDTLYMVVYQSNISNANSNILNYSFLKSSILTSPISSYSFNSGNSTGPFKVPWNTMNRESASVLVNNTPLDANSWSILNSQLTTNVTTHSNIEIIATGPASYYSIGPSNISTLTCNLYVTDNTIAVASVSGFFTPVLSNTSILRGQVFVNQECITYLGIDPVNKLLTGIMRGTSGTGVPNVHLEGARVVSAGPDRLISTLSGVSDPGISIWYTYPLNNTSLQNTASTISNVLISIGSVLPVTQF